MFLELRIPATDTVTGFFHYNPLLFEAATIQRLANHFLTLLSHIAHDPQQPVQIPMLTAAERHQLLVNEMTQASIYHQLPTWTEQTIHQRFAAQAARTPDAIAVTLADDLTQDEGRGDEGRIKN